MISLTTKEAAQKLYDLIEDCDPDTLAAIIQFSFAAAEKAIFNDETSRIDIELKEGMTEVDLWGISIFNR